MWWTPDPLGTFLSARRIGLTGYAPTDRAVPRKPQSGSQAGSHRTELRGNSFIRRTCNDSSDDLQNLYSWVRFPPAPPSCNSLARHQLALFSITYVRDGECSTSSVREQSRAVGAIREHLKCKRWSQYGPASRCRVQPRNRDVWDYCVKGQPERTRPKTACRGVRDVAALPLEVVAERDRKIGPVR